MTKIVRICFTHKKMRKKSFDLFIYDFFVTFSKNGKADISH